MKRLLAILTFLFTARLISRGNPPDYLTNDREPAVQASQLASPFTEFVTEQPPGWLRPLSSEPFTRYAGFSLEPRLYYRSFQNSSGLQDAFAAGGLLSFTTGWWRDTFQLGVTGYTTQPVIAPNGAGNTGLLRPNGDGFSVVGQAWAKVKAGPATATLFRQAIQLPFINGNDSRMIPNTFEAYQAGRTWKFSQDLEIRGDLQFVDQRSIGSELLGTFNTQLYGARLTASFAGALLSLEFTDTADGTGIRNPFGGDPSFNSLMISNFNQAGEKSYRIGITYSFSRFRLTGLTAFASYAYGSMPVGRWEEEVNATLDYRIATGALKNCWVHLRYAYNASSAPMPTEDFRVILNYTINF